MILPDYQYESCLQSVKDTKFESNSQLSILCQISFRSCLQSVKDTKFESNSQLLCDDIETAVSCLQSVKDTKFESNSQLNCHINDPQGRCLQSVKDTKFESNSQLMELCPLMQLCCLQSVKDTKFESNSQHQGKETIDLLRCLQSVKDTKFESNSQHMVNECTKRLRCLQSVKDTKFESNSQQNRFQPATVKGCLQSVKDTKFESNSQLSSERIEIRVFSFRNASVKKGVGVRLILPTLEHCTVCFIPSGTLFRCHGRALGFYTFDRFITFYLPFMTFICHFFKIVNGHFIEIISKTSSMIILVGKFRHTVVPAKLPYYFYSFYHCSINLIYIMPSRSLGISGNRNFVPMSNRISYWLSESKIP